MKTDRGPIGIGPNTPNPDRGTSALTENLPRVPAGQPGSGHGALVAQALPREQMDTRVEILARFDYKNAVIWLNEDSLNKMIKAFHAQNVLNIEDIKTLAHEFAHICQHADVFEKYTDRKARAQALIEQDIERISKMTEAQYIDFRLEKERQAEKIANIVVAEVKKSEGLAGFAEQDADTWIHNARWDYVEGDAQHKGYRAHYQETRAALNQAQQSASSQPAAAVSSVAAKASGGERSQYVMKPVGGLVQVFPGKEESATLFKLLERMKRYEVYLVVRPATGSTAKG